MCNSQLFWPLHKHTHRNEYPLVCTWFELTHSVTLMHLLQFLFSFQLHLFQISPTKSRADKSLRRFSGSVPPALHASLPPLPGLRPSLSPSHLSGFLLSYHLYVPLPPPCFSPVTLLWLWVKLLSHPVLPLHLLLPPISALIHYMAFNNIFIFTIFRTMSLFPDKNIFTVYKSSCDTV